MIFSAIRQYCFVFNNKTDASLTMNISQEIEKLKSEYSDIQFSLWDNQIRLMMFCNLDEKAQDRVLSHYMEKQYDAKEYLEKLQFENIVYDTERLRALKEEAYVDVIDSFDGFIQKLENIKFNDNQLEYAKMESLSGTNILLS